MKTFLSDYFAGSYRMEHPEPEALAVMVSPNRFARLLRSIFSAVYGQATLEIAFTKEEETLWMHFSFPKDLLSEDAHLSLFRLAMEGNLAVKKTESGFAVGLSLTYYGKNRVYARTLRELYEALEAVFFDR